MEGGSCAITHTGSVSVAGSQSNIVCKEECVSESVSTGYAKQVSMSCRDDMQVDMGRGDDVGHGKSVQVGVGRGESSAKHESGVISVKNPYNNFVKHTKGVLSVKNEHVASKPSLKSRSSSKPSSVSTKRLRDYFNNISAINSSRGTVGRGKNLNVTPTKRKLLENKQVALLVPVFDSEHISDISPVESESSVESPAKRPKLETGVKHLASQPPKFSRR